MKKKNVTVISFLFLVFLGAFLYTCKSPAQPDPNPGETAKEDPSFAADIQAIFNGNCVGSGCHNATASAGLNLTQGQAYNNLVNVVSTSEPNFQRVLPNDAQNSYLVMKVEGRQTVGNRMPLNRSPLTTVQIQNIKNWINKGANQNLSRTLNSKLLLVSK